MLRLVALFFLFHLSIATYSQCINTFPYLEDFETSNGNWTGGGSVGVDWSWGSPTKPVISSAASGVKCWIVGGLTTSFYNSGERSFVQSPCFDFTTVQHPFIAFSLFWESEKTYDGSNLQYSLDAGSTWANVGSVNDVADCLNTNWYNTANVTNLTGLATPKEGWSGNTQATSGSCQGGNGSGNWVLAQHCMANLAGEPNVVFRFTFGAGTTCNNYDGIAFDHVSIGEAPVNTADFNFTCTGDTFLFNGITAYCPSSMQWDFGDGNTATGLSSIHAYAAPGIYNVSFSVSGTCNAPATITKQVEVAAVTLATLPATCNGRTDGKAFVSSVIGTGPFSFSWSTNPSQTTDTAFSLSPGNYSVTVSESNSCPVITSVIVPVVQQAQVITLTTLSISDSCLQGKGTVGVNVLTGTAPFSYIWTPIAPDQAILNTVDSGNYAVHITDAAGCNIDTSILVGNIGSITKPNLGEDVGWCIARPFVLNAGIYSSYRWQDGSIIPILPVKNFGEYSVTVSNDFGCESSDTILVFDNCNSFIYFPSAFSPNNDGVNDLFKPKYSIDLTQYQMRIYNRWGELLYESTDVNEGWNGSFRNVPQPLGVYVWTSSYAFRDGKKNTESGNLTIVK